MGRLRRSLMWKKCNTFLTSRISVLQLKLVICYYSITAAFCKIVAKLQTPQYLLDCSCVIPAKQNWSSQESDYQSLTPSQWASSKCQEVLPLKVFKTESSAGASQSQTCWTESDMSRIILLLWSLGQFNRKILILNEDLKLNPSMSYKHKSQHIWVVYLL